MYCSCYTDYPLPLHQFKMLSGHQKYFYPREPVFIVSLIFNQFSILLCRKYISHYQGDLSFQISDFLLFAKHKTKYQKILLDCKNTFKNLLKNVPKQVKLQYIVNEISQFSEDLCFYNKIASFFTLLTLWKKFNQS